MGKNTDELQMLQKEIDKIPESNTARLAWQALGFVMTALKDTMNDFSEELKELRANVSDRFQRLETKMGTMESDIKLIQNNTNTTKNIISRMSNGNANKETHSESLPIEKSNKDKATAVLLEAMRLIGIGIVLWLLTDIFPRIFSLTIP